MCCLFKIKIQGVVLTCQNKFISQFIFFIIGLKISSMIFLKTT